MRNTAYLLPLTLWLCSAAHAQTPNTGTPEFNCRIEPHKVVDLASAVEGVIDEILITKNQQVLPGQVIAKLDSGVEAATVELRRIQADMESEITAAKLALEYSERNLKRVADLHKKKATSFATLDEARTEKALAEQEHQRALEQKRLAELELARAEANLARRTIKSPVAGVVIERYKEPGEHIDQEPIVQLAELDPLRVEVYIPANYFGKIYPGMNAKVTPELEGKRHPINAEVELVDRVVDAPSNTFGVRLSFANPLNELPSGLKCRIKFNQLK